MTDDKRNLLFLTILGGALFLLANGSIPVTDPVESNYTQTAKEMIAAGDYISPRIFGNFWYDKPIFFYWELIAAFSTLGFTDFAARLFPSVFGVIGLWLTYFFARKIYGAKIAFMSGVILATSLGYWVISKTIITDITLFVFFNSVLVFFYLAYIGKNKNLYYLCYIFAGLAVLTKGPIGILLPGLIITLFILWQRDFSEIKNMKPLGFVIFAAIVASWYVPMYRMHGSDFVNTFFGVHNVLRATVSEHPMWNVWWYYSVLFFIIFFPWAFFTALPKLYSCVKHRSLPPLDRTEIFLLIWAVVINVFYQNMATKYSTYTMPSMMPVAILAAKYLTTRLKIFRGVFTFSLVALVTVCLFGVVPFTNTKGYSGKDVGAFLTEHVKAGDMVANFDDYKVSRAYYSGFTIYQLESAGVIATSRPDGKSWQSKNVMPYWSQDDIPYDRTVYLIVGQKRFNNFYQLHPDEWTLLKEFARCRVYVREARK